MSCQIERQILDYLKKELDNRSIQLPAGIGFDGNGQNIIMTLTESGAGLGTKPMNMQKSGAAFEGWAAAVYAHYMKCIGCVTLDIPKDCALPTGPYTAAPHYSRFLYRAMKFSDQYAWFRLSNQLGCAVEEFRKYLSSHKVTNNFPQGEAADKGNLESKVEGQFSNDEDGKTVLRNLLGIRNNRCGIYRQLPVGLFEGEMTTEHTSLFTGRNSAVDLWTVSEDTLYAIELKADNKMVGAVTEIFFYANYVYDMYVQPAYRFFMNPGMADFDFRGYQKLLECAPGLRQVKGILLLDEGSVHPLISEGVLGVLNNIQLPEGAGPQPRISYNCLQYRLDMDVKVRACDRKEYRQ